MIEFRLSLTALGHTRFGYSPLGEVAASLRALNNQHAQALLRPWRREVGPALERMDLTLLSAVAPHGFNSPDFLYAWSTDPGVTIEDQLDALLDVPDETVAEQLRDTWDGDPPPVLDPLLNGRGRQALCDGLAAYWQVAVRPYWSRIRSAVDDDIAYRANRLLADGLFGLLGDLHSEVSIRDDVLAIDKPQHPDACYDTPMITLIPSVFSWPQLLVANSAPDSFELQYPARAVGRVWEGMTDLADVQEAFAALVGRGRAAVMEKVATPFSTTQIARDLGVSPAAVSAHLTVLRRNGLVSATRSGRSVLYQRTALGTSILAATAAINADRELA
jgi:DNA-binding transcriptional ArsR family regulator